MNPLVVILAAGASERLGQCKALVDLGGLNALERLIRAAHSAGASELVLVVGAHQREIASELARSDAGGLVRLFFNEHWARGRTGSVAVAASRFPGRALLLAPVDVPLVPSAVFRQLLQAWESAGDPPRGWLAPCVSPGPRYGHPVLVGRDLADLIRRSDPALPLAQLRALADPVWAVDVASSSILDDLDTPADLERLRAGLHTERETNS